MMARSRPEAGAAACVFWLIVLLDDAVVRTSNL